MNPDLPLSESLSSITVSFKFIERSVSVEKSKEEEEKEERILCG